MEMMEYFSRESVAIASQVVKRYNHRGHTFQGPNDATTSFWLRALPFDFTRFVEHVKFIVWDVYRPNYSLLGIIYPCSMTDLLTIP